MIAPVMPFRAFGDAPDQAQNMFFRSDAISFLYVPSTPSQTRLSAALGAGALEIRRLRRRPTAHLYGRRRKNRSVGFAERKRAYCWPMQVEIGMLYSVDQVVQRSDDGFKHRAASQR
jgi:hypothetical protein